MLTGKLAGVKPQSQGSSGLTKTRINGLPAIGPMISGWRCGS
jgi:hypothetical protein